MGHAQPKIEHLPAKLLAIRQQLRLSQTGMLRRLNLNCCYTRISEFERGRRRPNIAVLLAYARAANVPLENLVDDTVSLFGP